MVNKSEIELSLGFLIWNFVFFKLCVEKEIL